MRTSAVACCMLGILAFATAARASAVARPAPSARVLCSDAIDGFRSPPAAFPTILGRVELATTGTLRAVHLSSDPFPWWAKSGLVVRQGSSPVVISIPAAWRSRASIGWNNRGGAEVAIERVEACRVREWLAYPGGFNAVSRSCVPVDVTVGARHRRVWVAVGSRVGCPSGWPTNRSPARRDRSSAFGTAPGARA